MKKRRDAGFTLIELMIVIAVIGILAVVLVPKVGAVKSQAKGTGIETNARVVQGYIEGRINKWTNQNMAATSIATEIENAFTTDKLTNPYTSVATVPGKGNNDGDANQASLFIVQDGTGTDSVTDKAGTIVVTITGGIGSPVSPITSIKINGYDNASTPNQVTNVTVTP